MNKAKHSCLTGRVTVEPMTAEEIAEVEARPVREVPVDRLAGLEGRVAALEARPEAQTR